MQRKEKMGGRIWKPTNSRDVVDSKVSDNHSCESSVLYKMHNKLFPSCQNFDSFSTEAKSLLRPAF